MILSIAENKLYVFLVSLYVLLLCLGQSFKPVKVTENDESSFKVSEEPISTKNDRKGSETAGKSPPVITASNKSEKPGVAALNEVHKPYGTKIQTTTAINTTSHDADIQTSHVLMSPNQSPKQDLQPRLPEGHTISNITTQSISKGHAIIHNDKDHTVYVPYQIQSHALRLHPNLPPSETNAITKPSANLSKQLGSDLHGTKASNIHVAFQWGAFGKCSATCGEGVQKRYRKCNEQECTAPGIQTQVIPCVSSSCPGRWDSLIEKINK